jgi:hypothetical protein
MNTGQRLPGSKAPRCVVKIIVHLNESAVIKVTRHGKTSGVRLLKEMGLSGGFNSKDFDRRLTRVLGVEMSTEKGRSV